MMTKFFHVVIGILLVVGLVPAAGAFSTTSETLPEQGVVLPLCFDGEVPALDAGALSNNTGTHAFFWLAWALVSSGLPPLYFLVCFLGACLESSSNRDVIRPRTNQRRVWWRKVCAVKFPAKSFKKARRLCRRTAGQIQSWPTMPRTDQEVGRVFLAVVNFLSSIKYASQHPDPRTGYINAVRNLLMELGLATGAQAMVGGFINQMIFGGSIQSDAPTKDTLDAVGDILHALRHGTDTTQDVWSSPGMRKVKRVLLIALTAYVHHSDGMSGAALEEVLRSRLLFEPPMPNKFDQVLAIGDLILHVCESGYQYAKTGNLDVMFHGGSQYADFYDDNKWLTERLPYIHAPQLRGFTEAEFLSKLQTTLEKSDSIVKHARRNRAPELKYLERVHSDLVMMHASVFTSAYARRERETPFSLLVCGTSSVGKTAVCNALHKFFAHLMGEDPSSQSKYTRNPFSERWDGYRTSQWCIQMDDVAFMRPKNIMDPSVMDFLQVINCVPYCPEQAALEDKGKTPVRAKLVIASTNTMDLNTAAYFSEPSAVNRRFPIVLKVRPRPTHSHRGTLRVPTSEAPAAYPDYWLFDVVKVLPATKHGDPAIHETLVRDVGIRDVLEFLRDEYAVFRRTQDSMNTALEEYARTDYCGECSLPKQHCVCGRERPIWMSSEPTRAPPGPDMSGLTAFPASGEVQARMIDLSRGAWFSWLRSLWAPTAIGLHMVVWDGMWRSFSAEADMLWVTVTGFFALMWYLPTYGMIRRWVQVRFLEDHLTRTVGWVFYCWPEMKGPLANFLYSWTLRHDAMLWQYERLSRRAWSSMGSRRARLLGRGALVLSLVALVSGSAMLLYRFLRSDPAFQATAFDAEPDNSPDPLPGERVDPYRQGHVKLAPPPATHKSRCSTVPEFLNTLGRNVIHTNVVVGGKMVPGTMVGLVGSYYLAPNHVVPKGSTSITIIRQCGGPNQVTSNSVQEVDESCIYRDEDNDLALVHLGSQSPVRDIRDYFPTDSTFNGKCPATLSVNRLGNRRMIHYGMIDRQRMRTELGEFDMFKGGPDEPTIAGDCGSPLVAHGPSGPMLVAIHCMLLEGWVHRGPTTAATAVDRPWVDKALGHFRSRSEVQSGDIDLSGGRATVKLGALHYKSVFQYLESGEVDVYGSLEGVHRTKGKSNVTHTMAHDILRDRMGWAADMAPPDMASYRPWRIAALDMTNPVCGLEPGLLDECVNAYVADVLDQLGPDQLSLLGPYDFFTAVNGAPGVTYVDGFNRSTSAGFPWNHAKTPLLVPMEPTRGCQHPVDLLPEVWERVHAFEGKCLRGERCHPIFRAVLKDEPVSLKKASIGKTRIICAAPFDWGLVVRKYFLSFVRLQQNNTHIFEAASGTIAQSHEWGDLYRYITKYGDENMVAGDYKAYDKRMPAIMIVAAFRIIIKLYAAAGVPPEVLRVMETVAQDTAFPTVDYNGDLVMFHGSNPSGHPLTVQINSLANSLYMRYCYAKLGGSVREFRKDVALMTYGDDNVMGVRPGVGWFNHTSISEQLAAVDIVYTMADKSATSVPYVSADEVTFLKRRWVYADHLGDYSCPLEMASIRKMLMYRVVSKVESEQAQMVSQVRSAHTEAFYHGPQVFEQFDVLLRDLLVELGLQDYCDPALPTWGDYVERWLHNSPTGVEPTSGENH